MIDSPAPKFKPNLENICPLPPVGYNSTIIYCAMHTMASSSQQLTFLIFLISYMKWTKIDTVKRLHEKNATPKMTFSDR